MATEEFSLNDSDWSDVIQAVRDAGSRILQVMDQQELGVNSKSDGSPVTEADRQANQVILDFLTLRFPEIPCVSEESTHLPGQPNCWLIDPLDGTKEFISGRAEFTVNLALVAKGVPVAGVVYAPALDLLVASKEVGHLFVEGEPAKFDDPSQDSLRIAISRSHLDPMTEEFCKQMGRVQTFPMGSSLKLLTLALGVCDLYPRFGPTMEWDTAAAHAILVNQGGDIIDVNGERIQYGKASLRNPDFLAFAPSFEKRIPDAIEAWRRSQLAV